MKTVSQTIERLVREIADVLWIDIEQDQEEHVVLVTTPVELASEAKSELEASFAWHGGNFWGVRYVVSAKQRGENK